MSGHVWTCLDMSGHVWTCLDMSGHVWTCLDMSGHFGTLWRIQCIPGWIHILIVLSLILINFWIYICKFVENHCPLAIVYRYTTIKKIIYYKSVEGYSDLWRHYWTLLDIAGHCWTLLDIAGHFWTLLDISGHCWTFLDNLKCRITRDHSLRR